MAADPEIQVVGPIARAEVFVKIVQEQIARYHSKIVELLIAQLAGQMVLRRLAELAEKHRALPKPQGGE